MTYLSRRDIHVIRPMIYIPEGDIKAFSKRQNLPIVENPCPMDGKSKREEMKTFINEKTKQDKFFKTRTMHAIQTGLPNWIVK